MIYYILSLYLCIFIFFITLFTSLILNKYNKFTEITILISGIYLSIGLLIGMFVGILQILHQ